MGNLNNKLKSRIASFGYAIKGLKVLFREETNAQIHLLAAIIAVVLGFWLHISGMEWIAICLCIGLVIATEALNTAIEHIANMITLERHPGIERIKDIAAGAVLITALTALIVGLIIFLPKIYNLFLL
ncbi:MULTISPECIES: diacylglycerol kinase family protein [unclassified Sphingobacterium]|uniref:diacylglycerol kinase family protein n=1 Tax=unclassified Sphingobacterium TaxID=2609468 RepID=UPI0025F0E531|nr:MULTISPECIES: diacylglycerol kinase family protein [unclassified Sphingobacterium]